MFKSFLLSLLGSLVTEALVKQLFDYLMALVREQVKKSSTDLDDKALAELEAVLDEDELAKLLASWLNRKIKNG